MSADPWQSSAFNEAAEEFRRQRPGKPSLHATPPPGKKLVLRRTRDEVADDYRAPEGFMSIADTRATQREFAPPPDEPKREPRTLGFKTFDDFQTLPDPEWLIEGVLFRQTMNVMFGVSNAFKSFLLADIGLSILTGRDWCGVPVPKGRVCFIVSEGALGFGKSRIPAWFDHHGIPAADRSQLLIYPAAVKLDDPEAVSDLLHTIEAFGGVDFLGLDIFASMYSGEENEVKTAGKVVDGLQRIVSAGITVLAAAHVGFGQDAQKRARGSSHLWGSWDTRLEVKGDKDTLVASLTVERHKDAQSGKQWSFHMVPTGGSLVPVLAEGVSVRQRERPLPAKQALALEALAHVISGSGYAPSGVQFPPNVLVVPLTAWRAECKARSFLSDSDDPKTITKEMQRVKVALQGAHRIGIQDDLVWLA